MGVGYCCVEVGLNILYVSALSRPISPHTRSQMKHELESLEKYSVAWRGERCGKATHPAGFLGFFF
jgi:hypothetical protein